MQVKRRTQAGILAVAILFTSTIGFAQTQGPNGEAPTATSELYLVV